ncbi:MAG: hypothetical protein IT430_08405 [Phycisphaerales bacterium]|nr:hypothetical protein [Phycisphaerales bacterium]
MTESRAVVLVLIVSLVALPGCTLLFGDKWIDDMMTSPEFVCALIQASDEIEFGDLPDDAVVAVVDVADDGTAWAVLLHGKDERLQYFCEMCDGDMADMQQLWSHRIVHYPDPETAQRMIPLEYADVRRVLVMGELDEDPDVEPEN